MKRFAVGLFLSLLVFILMISAAGCLDKAKIKALYNPQDTPVPDAAQESGAPAPYILQGSVTAIALMQTVSDALASEHPIDFAAVGKDEAIAAVADGQIDAAMFDGSLSELDNPSNGITIADEGVRIIVNSEFPADDIDYDQLVAIFTDQDNILADQEVHIVITAPQALSRKVFEDIFPIRGDVDGTLESLIPEVATVVSSDEEVVSAVEADPSAIGVIGITASCGTCKVLRIDGAAPDDDGYPGIRSLILLCRDMGGETSQAIVAFLQSPQAARILTDNGYASVK